MRLSKAIPLGLLFSGTMSAAHSVEQLEADPAGRLVIAGYGDVKYEQVDSLDTSAFSARFVPIFLFSLNDKMHVEAETEIALNEEGEAEVELEYADLHYFLNNATTVTAGKFLLPFGQFGANWHPSWINRSPWTPGIYGSHGGTQAMTPLLPVLSDVGLAIQHTVQLSSNQKLFFDFYVTNGARQELEEHDEEETVGETEEEEEHSESVPEVEFEAFSSDNNKDKAFGGRIAYAFLPSLEMGASWYQASYDVDEKLDVVAKGIDLNLIGNYYILRGEYIQTETDGEEEGSIETFKRNGWFLQGVVQLGHIYPAFGGTELLIERAETNKIAEATRWVYGVNYWLDARSVVKVAYEKTDLREGEDDHRVAVQLSYGF